MQDKEEKEKRQIKEKNWGTSVPEKERFLR